MPINLVIWSVSSINFTAHFISVTFCHWFSFIYLSFGIVGASRFQNNRIAKLTSNRIFVLVAVNFFWKICFLGHFGVAIIWYGTLESNFYKSLRIYRNGEQIRAKNTQNSSFSSIILFDSLFFQNQRDCPSIWGSVAKVLFFNCVYLQFILL